MATQVGEAIVKLSFDGSSVKSSLNKAGSEISSTGKASGSKWGTAWAVAAGNLIASGVKKVANMVSSHMNDAISRLDTLNNFPKVMQSLGYSAEESESSIAKLSDGLDGLPTTLDDMANGVQMLSATMGNLDQGMVNATSVGLSLNNMFLASGKGTQEASMALENYNKMLATGKVDLQHWQSLVISAPGQMDQLAKSMIGANANQQDLYKAMQAGTITFDDLNAKIVELNEQGGENFASFADQAVAATGGIATQLQNISTTVTKIITAAMDNNGKAVEKGVNQLVSRVGAVAPQLISGFSTAFVALAGALPEIVASVLPSLLEGLQTMLDGLIAVLPTYLDTLLPAIIAGAGQIALMILSALPQITMAITNSLPTLLNALMAVMTQMVQAIPTILPQLAVALTDLVGQVAIMITDPGFLALMLDSAITLFMTLVDCIPEIITRLLDALPKIITNIVNFLTNPSTINKLLKAAVKLFLALVKAVPQILGQLVQAFGTLVGNLWNNITRMFGEFASNFGNFIGGIFKNAINGVISFIENFINGPIDILNGFLDVINDAFGWLGVHIDHIDRINLPRLAMGGVVTSETIAMIGEQGDEAVLPLDNNTEWAGTLASLLTEQMNEQNELEDRPINVTLNNNINNRLDAQEIGRVMIESIRRAA